MESSAHTGDKTTTLDDDEALKVAMGSIAKRPCTVLLEEKIEENFQPTEEELLEYALWLGMTIPRDMDLIWIARDGLTQPLPEEWKPCQTEDDEVYYFNFETGESVWDHPCDGLYRKLYQEECKKLGKRPYQIRENLSSSSNLQQKISNWGETSTYPQASHQMNYTEMLSPVQSEKEKVSPRGPPTQDDLSLESLPSKKEIQMTIVENEINSLKGIRDQLLQKMSEVWQEEQFSPMASPLVVDRVANYNEVEPNNVSLLEGRNDQIQSVEMEHFTELNTQSCGQNWKNMQLHQDEDPHKTKERTELLRKQLEMAKMIPPQLANRAPGVRDCRQMYEDHHRWEHNLSRGPPIKYAPTASQEANGKHSLVSDHGKDAFHRVLREQLKNEELVLVNEMKERILMQVRNSMEEFERNHAFEEYEMVLTRKKENLELLRKELRKDMEFELLLEEESILKTKKEELIARVHSQVPTEHLVVQEGPYKVTKGSQLANCVESRLFLPKHEKPLETLRAENPLDSIRLNREASATTSVLAAPDYEISSKTTQGQPKGKEALYHRDVCDEGLVTYERENFFDVPGVSSSKGASKKLDVDEDLEELFLQCSSKVRDDIVSLKSKMNEILVSHAKANQLNVETASIPAAPREDRYMALHNRMPVVANPTQLLYTLQRSIGELVANLKHLLEERKVGLDSKNMIAHSKEQQSTLPTQNDAKGYGHHPGDFSTDILSILKEFLVVIDKELEKSINHHYEDVIKTDIKIHKSQYCLPHVEEKALDTKQNDGSFLSETSLILKRLTEKIEKHVEPQTAQQEGRSRDNRAGFGEIPTPKYHAEPHSISLNGEMQKNFFDVHNILTQFKAISTDIISSLKGFIGQLDGDAKEVTQPCQREVRGEVSGSRRQNYESTISGHGTVFKDQQTSPFDDNYANIHMTSKVALGETSSYGKLSVNALHVLERFICRLYHELKDQISRQDRKVYKTIDGLQMDSKQLDTNFQLQEIPSGDACGISTIPDLSCNGLYSKTVCSSQQLGLVEGMHQGTTSSVQHKCITREDKNSSFPFRSAPHEATGNINSLLLLETNPDIQSALLRTEGDDLLHVILELDKLFTKSLHVLEKFQTDLDKDLHKQALQKKMELSELDATDEFQNGKLDSASSPEGASFDASGKSIRQERVKMTLDSHSISYNIMSVGLKNFIAEVDGELKAIIQNCKRKLKNENGKLRSETKDEGVEHEELYFQAEISKLESESFIPLLKAWSTEIEKSTQHLLQHFKSELMEEMNTLQQKKANKPSAFNCDELQPLKPRHLSQVQALMAEEKRIWYDILNDATKQWLQKEWVERLEHQSDFTTTCDNSTSPPTSESLAHVHQVLGEETKIMCDILNHSTQTWLVHKRNSLVSQRTSEVKGLVQEITGPQKGGFKEDQTPSCTMSRQQHPRQHHTCKHSCQGNNVETSQILGGRSSTTDIVHLEEESQSNLFAKDLEVMTLGCLSGNLDCCVVQSSCSGKDNENNHSSEADQKVKLIHNLSVSENNLSSINRWISKAEPFVAFNHVNEVGMSVEGELCEECQKHNILDIHGVKQEAHGRQRRKVPRTISQLKLVSKRSWRTLQSKLRVAEATRWAHMIGSRAIEQMSCGLLLKKRHTYPFVIQKSIRAILEKTTCGKALDSTASEDLEHKKCRDHKKGIVSDGPTDNIIQKYYGCYPFVKHYLTSSTNFKHGNGPSKSIVPADLGDFDKPRSPVAYREVKSDFPGGEKFDASPAMDGRPEILPSDSQKLQSAESIANSFVKYQSDDNLAPQNVENPQDNCQTPMSSSINLREVDMHELEEAINSLRRSREHEAKGKLLWVNYSHVDGDQYEDEHIKDYHVKPAPTDQRELENKKPFDFSHGDKNVNQSKCKETQNAHVTGEVPKFITFEILQQGEIGLVPGVLLN